MFSTIQSKFFLIKNKRLSFTDMISERLENYNVRTVLPEVQITPTGKENHLSQNDCDSFIALMEGRRSPELPKVNDLSVGENLGSKETCSAPQRSWGITIKIGVIPSKCLDLAVVKITDNPSGGGFLERLCSASESLGCEPWVRVKFGDIGGYKGVGGRFFTKNAYTEESTPSVNPDKTYSIDYTGIVGTCTHGFMFWDKDPPLVIDGEVDIIVTLVKKAAVNLNSVLPESCRNVNRRILEDETASDVSILAANGNPVKCHKNFLFAHSSVFKAMFKEGFEESKTNIIEMPDMTETSVRALLKYIYLKETADALELSVTAFELLQAGHKYAIKDLEEAMKPILLSQPDTWYDLDVAVRLYLFAKNIDGGEEMKMKAVKIIKLNHKDFKTSSSLRHLFKNDPEGAMALYQCTCLI